MIRPKVRTFSPADSQSSERPDLGLSGNARYPTVSASRPMGTLTANSHCQLATARIAEAMLGPITAAMETTMAFRPTPRPSWLWGKV